MLAATLVGSACSTGSGTPGTTTGLATTTPVPPTTRPQVSVPTYLDASGFDDHTVPLVASVEEFFALARPASPDSRR